MNFLQSANPVLPLWIVLLLGGSAATVIVMHLALLAGAEMPARRRRIRLANGVLLLAVTVLLTYALGFVGMLPSGGGSIGEIREFVLVWLAIIGLIPMVLALAALDVINTWRLQREARRLARRRRRAEMLRDVEIHVAARLGSPNRGERVASRAAEGSGGTGGTGDDDARS
jgi:hypothetical protein